MANNVMFFCIAFVMLCKMRMRRVVRRLSQKGDGEGWQVVWIESPVEPATQTMPHVYPNEENEMKKISSRRGCLLGVILIVAILLLGGGWWLYRSQSLSFEGAIASSLSVTITSPASGDDVNAGDFVPISAQVVSSESIQKLELFIDGQSLGKVTDPTTASWTWQAWPLGIHSFYAQATDTKGQVGFSQVVIVNVLVGDRTLDVFAEQGQTLEQIGAGYGVPPDQMAGANPNLNPSQPLSGGNQVQVPIVNIEPQNLPGGNFTSIKWKIKINQTVNKSYCYVSTVDGVWEKIPKGPFTYFYGQENYYTQLIPNTGQSNLQMQCWGWVGGTLKYLGQGQGQIDPAKAQGEVTIDGGGFIIIGFFKIPDYPPIKTTGGNNSVTPPFAVREASNVEECLAHGDPIVAGFLCAPLVNAKVKQNIVLIWEWNPEVCAPGFCKYGVNTIKGYGVYEIDPATKKHALIADVKSSAMRVAFPPLPWGPKCYGVEAYVDYPGSQVSEMITYCPGSPPQAQKITLTPTDWLTAKGLDFASGDCDDYGLADSYLLENQSGFGNQPGQVLVGDILVDTDCVKFIGYSAGVKFLPEKSLPPNAVVQKAVLTFSKIFMDYGATGWAGGKPTSCVASVGKANQSWTQLVSPNHFADNTNLSAYNSPIVSLNPFMALNADVTSAVNYWVKHPESNHGLILNPVGAPLPGPGNGTGECTSGLGNFKLDIYYFALP